MCGYYSRGSYYSYWHVYCAVTIQGEDTIQDVVFIQENTVLAVDPQKGMNMVCGTKYKVDHTYCMWSAQACNLYHLTTGV